MDMVLDLTDDDFVCDMIEVGTASSFTKRVHRTAEEKRSRRRNERRGLRGLGHTRYNRVA